MILRRLFRPINIRRTFSRIHSRSISFQIVDCNLTEHSVKADEGDTLLEICEKHSIEVEAACGGECCCSTCHCFLSDELFEAIEEPDEDELDMLDLAIGVQETSRLACQVKITPGFESTIVRLATETSNQLSWIVLHSTPRTKLCSNGNFSTCRNFSMKTCSTYLFEDLTKQVESWVSTPKLNAILQVFDLQPLRPFFFFFFCFFARFLSFSFAFSAKSFRFSFRWLGFPSWHLGDWRMCPFSWLTLSKRAMQAGHSYRRGSFCFLILGSFNRALSPSLSLDANLLKTLLNSESFTILTQILHSLPCFHDWWFLFSRFIINESLY